MVVHQLKAEIINYNYIKYGALQATAFQEQWESKIWNSSFAADEWMLFSEIQSSLKARR